MGSERPLDRSGLARVLRRVVARWSPTLFVRCFAPDDRELGELGEEIVARALRRSGYRVLARRMETPDGEIDILAHDGTSCVCVEVKTGRTPAMPRPRGATSHPMQPRWRPGVRLRAAQASRLTRIARRLTQSRQLAGPHPLLPRSVGPARVDLVEVFFDPEERSWRICHHQDLRGPLGRSPPARRSAWLA